MATIKKSGTVTRKGDVLRWMRSIGPTLTGREIRGFKGKSAMVRNAFFSTLSVEFFHRLTMSLEQRSDGMSDEFGNRWKPLSEHTRIYRRLSGEERRRYKVGNNKGRGLLTAAEDKIWRKEFAQTFSRLVLFMPEKQAKAKAAKRAWHVVKSMGAKTKKQVLKNREVKILNASGRLFESMRPSSVHKLGYYRPKKEQIAVFKSGKIEYGTKVPYASHVNKERQLIPNQYEKWVEDGVEQAIQKIMKMLTGNIT